MFLSVIIVSYLLVVSLLRILPVPSRWRCHAISAVMKGYAKSLLLILGVRVDNPGVPPRGAVLILANHLSYLDIPVLASWMRVRFITSMDIGAYFLPALLARISGTLIVNRRSPRQLRREITEIVCSLTKGVPVVLFAEATSGDGSRVLPFRPSLVQTAIDAGVPVLPLTISYFSIDGRPIDTGNRDQVFWYGDMSFFPHLLQLVHRRVRVRLIAGAVIPTEHAQRKQVCQAAYREVSRSFSAVEECALPRAG